ncbi:MAG: 4Fe-4S binding protein [Synergistaceae bacterium]|nr:4Fe-4S binding protein [Synergistaceae bacterium]
MRSQTPDIIGDIKRGGTEIGCDRMAAQIRKAKKAKVLKEDCVACGACVKACPVSAIIIYKGITAEVDADKCIGCTKCVTACPASAIYMEAQE